MKGQAYKREGEKMLRESDFTLTGEVDRLDKVEKDMLINDIYYDCKTSVKAYIEYTVGADHGTHFLYQNYRSSFVARKSVLNITGIKVSYRGAFNIHPLDIANDFVAEFERKEEVS